MQPLCQAAGDRGCEVCQEWSRGGGRHTAEANQDFHGGHTRRLSSQLQNGNLEKCHVLPAHACGVTSSPCSAAISAVPLL